jgi:hypothetical protein
MMTAKKTEVNDVYIFPGRKDISMNMKVIAFFAVLMLTLAAAGCVSQQSGGLSSTKSSVPQEAVYSGNNAPAVAQDTVGYSRSVPASGPATAQSGQADAGIDTKIIKTAYITAEVKDVTDSVETIRNLATMRGGYVSSTSIQKNYNDQLTGSVILRVPAAEFDTTIAGVKAIGVVKSISTQGQDVTEEYVDVQAQIASYQNQLAQYNEIMKKAVKVQDVLDIQQQIDRVQTELDRLNGRLKFLNSRIDLSTITVTLQEPEPVGGQGGHDFVAAFNEGIAGFFGVIDTLIVAVLSLLPLIILGCAVYGVYRLWRKKYPEKPGKSISTSPKDEENK